VGHEDHAATENWRRDDAGDRAHRKGILAAARHRCDGAPASGRRRWRLHKLLLGTGELTDLRTREQAIETRPLGRKQGRRSGLRGREDLAGEGVGQDPLGFLYSRATRLRQDGRSGDRRSGDMATAASGALARQARQAEWPRHGWELWRPRGRGGVLSACSLSEGGGGGSLSRRGPTTWRGGGTGQAHAGADTQEWPSCAKSSAWQTIYGGGQRASSGRRLSGRWGPGFPTEQSSGGRTCARRAWQRIWENFPRQVGPRKGER
jgi:hypothetical protein